MTITKVLTPVAFVALLSLSAAPAHADQRGGGGRYRAAERGHVVVRGGGGYVRARAPYYRPYYYRPYYSFRPRVSLGVGVWMGYPVPYPYYVSPYAYAPQYGAPSVYAAPAPNYPSSNYPTSNYPSSNYPSANYPSSNYPSANYPSSNYPAPSVDVQRRGAAPRAGISFEITPQNAAVFVDGNYVGTAEEFGPSAPPLDLAPGSHRVEVRAQGYRTLTSDADVEPGQVIPFQGTLQRN
jgi:hypothetical protein